MTHDLWRWIKTMLANYKPNPPALPWVKQKRRTFNGKVDQKPHHWNILWITVLEEVCNCQAWCIAYLPIPERLEEIMGTLLLVEILVHGSFQLSNSLFKRRTQGFGVGISRSCTSTKQVLALAAALGKVEHLVHLGLISIMLFQQFCQCAKIFGDFFNGLQCDFLTDDPLRHI